MAKPFRIRTGALASALLLLGAPALSLAVGGGDLDGDGIPDEVDNCLARANPDQVDTNADGFGNLCDPDLDNDGSVSFSDLSILKAAFFSSPQTPNWDPDADLSGDEQVNFTDLAVMRSFFFLPPGPAGVVRWANPAGGDWDTPENWLPVGPPRPENLVILDLPDADPVITLTGGSADIYALVSTERLEIIDDDVALSVRGPSSIDGELILTAGGTLIADGEDAVVSVGDSSDLDDGSLIARGGAELTLEQSDIAMALDQATWLAEGAGSRIAFPNLTLAAAGVVGSSSAVRWTVEARDGGVIEMPGLSTMEIVGQSVASRIEIVADGTGSAVSAPMLTRCRYWQPWPVPICLSRTR
ncbi:MAG: thrombospondin type 3 repeat-containing protein [Pseudomonadota bacterium]